MVRRASERLHTNRRYGERASESSSQQPVHVCSGNTDVSEDVNCTLPATLKSYSNIIVIDPSILSAQAAATSADQKQLICCNPPAPVGPAPPPPPPGPPAPAPKKCRGNTDQSTDYKCDRNQYGVADASHMYVADSTTLVCGAATPSKTSSAATAKVGVMLLLAAIGAFW